MGTSYDVDEPAATTPDSPGGGFYAALTLILPLPDSTARELTDKSINRTGTQISVNEENSMIRRRHALAACLGLALAFAGGCVVDLDQGEGLETVDESGQALGIAPTPPPFFAGDVANDAPFGLDICMWTRAVNDTEMACFWDAGVRSIVVGTQVPEVFRQHVEMSVRGGMVVDAYVYLYWSRSVTAQVEASIALMQEQAAAGFPVNRLWLDVEEAADADDVHAQVQEGLDVCASHGVSCGIYTGAGFWREELGDTRDYANIPLWYAWYGAGQSLDDWDAQHFGGWAFPTAKQYAGTKPMCGVSALDFNVMQIEGEPKYVIDRSPLPATTTTPSAPVGLWPANGDTWTRPYIKLMAASQPSTSRWQFELQRFVGSTWVRYNVWTSPYNAVVVYPIANSSYRFRARAENAFGAGAWSNFSTFHWGNPRTRGPISDPAPGPMPAPRVIGSTTPPPPPPPAPPPAPAPAPVPPASADVCDQLTPNSGTFGVGNVVTLACSGVARASRYEFAIEVRNASGAFVPYYTYVSTTAAKAFAPQTRGTFGFRVRAEIDGTWRSASSTSSFEVR
jgi:hypothetical protein